MTELRPADFRRLAREIVADMVPKGASVTIGVDGSIVVTPPVKESAEKLAGFTMK